MSAYSPWGEVQHTTPYMRGLAFVSTASHGGMRVSKSLCEKYPFLVEVNQFSGYGGFHYGYYFFEEDCEYAAPALLFCGTIYKASPWVIKPFPTVEDFRKYLLKICWEYYPSIMEKYFPTTKVQSN